MFLRVLVSLGLKENGLKQKLDQISAEIDLTKNSLK